MTSKMVAYKKAKELGFDDVEYIKDFQGYEVYEPLCKSGSEILEDCNYIFVNDKEVLIPDEDLSNKFFATCL